MNGPLFFWFRDKLLMLFKPCRYWISLRAAWLRRSESPENCQPQTGGYRWFRMVGKCYQLRKPFFFFVALLWQVAWTAGGRRAQKLWGPGYDAMARTEKKQHWGKKMEKENTNLWHPLTTLLCTFVYIFMFLHGTVFSFTLCTTCTYDHICILCVLVQYWGQAAMQT